MSSVAIQGNAAGAGVFTIASPNSASSYTATLPTATTTLVGTDATQTLTNKTLTSPTMTGAVVSSMASSVITSGTSVASTSGTSITFSSIPSWVKRITVMFNGVSTTGTSIRGVRLGSGSTQSTGYISASNWYTGASTGSSNSDTSILVLPGGAAADLLYGTMTINLLTGNTWVSSLSIYMNSPTVYGSSGAGTVTLSGTLDRVVLTTVGGTDTFDAGSINILYE